MTMPRVEIIQVTLRNMRANGVARSRSTAAGRGYHHQAPLRDQGD